MNSGGKNVTVVVPKWKACVCICRNSSCFVNGREWFILADSSTSSQSHKTLYDFSEVITF